MSEPGGSATQSGILLQNSLVGLFLGRLCDHRRRPSGETIVRVQVETLDPVDDAVITFADGRRTFVQSKDRIRPGTEDWRSVWRAFERQFQANGFRQNGDRLWLHLGQPTHLAETLDGLCTRAATSASADELRLRLTKEHEKLLDAIVPHLESSAADADMLAFFSVIDVHAWSVATIERDLVPVWMPPSSVSERTLFALLRDRVGGSARVKMSFQAVNLKHDLERSHKIRFGSGVEDIPSATGISIEPTRAEPRLPTHALLTSSATASGGTQRSTFFDNTTLLGAARALDREAVRTGGLPLTSLLSLSQLVEAIVLYDDLRFESGTTDTWGPYVEAFQQSIIGKVVASGEVPLRPAEGQCDTSERSITSAVEWSIDKIENGRIAPVFWAARFRRTALGSVDGAPGRPNETLHRYLQIARSNQGVQFERRVQHVFEKLGANEIEPQALLVLVRGKLLQQWILAAGDHYFPHYSRQPLLLSASEPEVPVERWTMDRLSNVRNEILSSNEEPERQEPLADLLSPIFLACLQAATSPEDILTQACRIRASKSAGEFRRELSAVLEASRKDPATPVLYKARLRERLAALHGSLPLNLSGASVLNSVRETRVGLPSVLSWEWGWMRAGEAEADPHHYSVVFLTNVLRRSLGIRRAEEELKRVFGVTCEYDIDLLANGAPRTFQT